MKYCKRVLVGKATALLNFGVKLCSLNRLRESRITLPSRLASQPLALHLLQSSCGKAPGRRFCHLRQVLKGNYVAFNHGSPKL